MIASDLTWAGALVVLAAVCQLDAGRVTEARVSSGDHLQQAVIIITIIIDIRDAVIMLPHAARVVLALTTQPDVGAASLIGGVFPQRRRLDVVPDGQRQQHCQQQDPRATTSTHCVNRDDV